MPPISVRKLASNYSFLVAGEICSKIFTLIAFTYLARILGPENYGHVEFTIALIVFFTLLVDFGSGPIGAREIAKDNQRIRDLLANIAALRFIFSIIAYICLAVFVFFLREKPAPVRNLILLYGLTLFASPGLIHWIFQGLQKMKWVGLASVVRQSVFAAVVLLFVHNSSRLQIIGWAECISVGFLLLYYFLVFRSEVRTVKFRFQWDLTKSLFVSAAPIGLSELAWALIWYSATVLLGLLIGGKPVGWFGAAHRTIMACHTFVWLYFYNLLPSISQCVSEPKKALASLLNNSLMVNSWLAIFVGVMGTALAGPLLTTMFGSQFKETASTFQILIWVVSLLMISNHYSYTLIAYGFQKIHLLCFGAAMVVGICLGLILIPVYDDVGAALAILGGLSVQAVLAYWFAKKKVIAVPFIRPLIKPLVTGGLILLSLNFIHPVHSIYVALAISGLFAMAIFFLQPNLPGGLVAMAQKSWSLRSSPQTPQALGKQQQRAKQFVGNGQPEP